MSLLVYTRVASSRVATRVASTGTSHVCTHYVVRTNQCQIGAETDENRRREMTSCFTQRTNDTDGETQKAFADLISEDSVTFGSLLNVSHFLRQRPT